MLCKLKCFITVEISWLATGIELAIRILFCDIKFHRVREANIIRKIPASFS